MCDHQTIAGSNQMALDSNTWLNREQHKCNNETQQQQIFVTENHQQQRGLLKIPTKSSILTQTERFTQTEYRGGTCVESSSPTKEVIMFDPLMQQPQPNQMYAVVEKKEPGEKSTVAEFPFCYNVNMLQKVQQQQTSTVAEESKTCYRLDVAQPFSYNYALVNQMSLAAAASTATFKCDVCGLVFGHLSLLNHHKRIHTSSNPAITNDRSFSCEQPTVSKPQVKKKCCKTCGVEMDCEHSVKKKAKFVKCENCHTSSSPPPNGGYQSPQESSPPQEIVTKGLHLVKPRGMATVTKCHKCNGSGLIFVGGARPTGDKPFRCNLCDGSFSRYSSLWSHKRLHTGDKPFKCDLCGLTFARAAYLKNHIRVHSGEKPFKCSVCDMQFSQSPHLKNHERIHSGERPYQCEVCEKTFARHSTLWNHRRIHTGEKPYRCGVCGSAFNQATHLKNHAKVHTGEKPHRCDICEVAFSDRFALKRHRSIHEKYGRTATNGQQQPSQQPQQQQQTQPQQQQQPPPPPPQQMEELYKCEVGGQIAFPGCSRPQEQKQ